jgi:hypothetical protein
LYLLDIYVVQPGAAYNLKPRRFFDGMGRFDIYRCNFAWLYEWNASCLSASIDEEKNSPGARRADGVRVKIAADLIMEGYPHEKFI